MVVNCDLQTIFNIESCTSKTIFELERMNGSVIRGLQLSASASTNPRLWRAHAWTASADTPGPHLDGILRYSLEKKSPSASISKI